MAKFGTSMQMADHEIHEIDTGCEFDSPKYKKQKKVTRKYRPGQAEA